MRAPADAVYRWGAGGEMVAARTVAYLPTGSGWRVLARDTADRLHILDVDAGGARVVASLVSLSEAIAAVETAAILAALSGLRGRS